jgi:uncharacterized protein Yka (UPF0111/DUF47 family)
VKRWFLPYTPDVLGLVLEQSEITCRGMDAFVRWSSGESAADQEVRRYEHEADEVRRRVLMELRAAFSTPLDPEDIYELSERLDEVLNGAKNAVREAELLGLAPDPPLAEMSEHLHAGVKHLHDAIVGLQEDRDDATDAADKAIKCERNLEHSYRTAMSALVDNDDLKLVTARREIYRRYARIGESLVRVAHRVWYSVVKER